MYGFYIVEVIGLFGFLLLFVIMIDTQPHQQVMVGLPDLKIGVGVGDEDYGVVREVEREIRNAYLGEKLQPYYFCSYEAFAKVFPTPSIYEAYKAENLNIIEMHLRYGQYIHQKLAIFKWVPSLAVAVALRLNPVGLLFPLAYVKFVDHYFKDFMIWKYSKEKIINIQPQFSCKLSKTKNMKRRLRIFEQLRPFLSEQSPIPQKYLKFGHHTDYLFHTMLRDIEQSSSYLTPFFQNVLSLTNIDIATFKKLPNYIRNVVHEFKEFKGLDRSQMPIFIDRDKLMTYKDMKSEQKYSLTKQMEMRIRRIAEIGMYLKSGKIFMSGFSFTDLRHLNRHYDLLQEEKYNLETNAADFVLFYGTVLTFKLGTFIIKRAIKM